MTTAGQSDALYVESRSGFTDQSDPPAGTIFAQIANLAKGVWDVDIYINLSGTTTGPTDRANMRFHKNGNAVARFTMTMGGVADSFKYRVYSNADDTTIDVRNVVTGTAGSVYRATLIATKVG